MSDLAVTVVLEPTVSAIITGGIQGPPGVTGARGLQGLQGIQGVIGVTGPTGPDSIVSVNFAYNEVSPAVITVLAGVSVIDVRVIIDTVFDGVGASISVGDGADNSILMTSAQNDPTAVGTYSATPNKFYASETVVGLYFSPGDSAHSGAGRFLIFFGV